MLIVFLLYDGMTALDAIGPHEVLCRLPGVTIKRVANQAGLVYTESAHLTITAEYALSDIPKADVLVIPGAGNATTLQNNPNTLAWIRDIHQASLWTTSVCTGSLILGAAGLLKGVQATSHWAAVDRLALWGAHPVKQRVVEAGKIMTAAGVSAGIDMALILAEKLCGPAIAQMLQLGLEYDPQPPFDAGSPEKVSSIILETLTARFVSSFEKINR